MHIILCYSNWYVKVEVWQLLPTSTAFYWRRKNLRPRHASELATSVCPSVWLWFQEINGLTTAVCPGEGQEKNPIKLQLQGVNVYPKHTEQRYAIYLRLGPNDVKTG